MGKKVLSKEETKEVLEEFYDDCLNYWLTQPDSGDLEGAKALTEKDLQSVTHNPLKPSGELLNKEAKEEFIRNLD